MSVIARSPSSPRLLRRRHGARAEGGAGSARPTPTGVDVRARNRLADCPQDETLYTCSCGFHFAAAVSASVDCPHCGDAQAW